MSYPTHFFSTRPVHLQRLLVLALLASLAGCGGGDGMGGTMVSAGFADNVLVANRSGLTATNTTIDANLSNPWGLALAPGHPIWIADNNSNLATLYGGAGANATGSVTGSNSVGIAIPPSAASVPSNPTGQVYNATGQFPVATIHGAETALFLYDGEGGTIAGWASDSGASAATVYDDGIANGAAHAVYKGLAIGSFNGVNYLYATDLHNNKIDVFDTTFSKPAPLQGKFIDPAMPAGFVPFGIQALGGKLYVSFARQDVAMHDETTGAGLGYVDVFGMDGSFISRFASAGVLNAPWGMALAPAGFGTFAGDLLIGNFGDGTINVFAPNGTSLAVSMGPLTMPTGQMLSIPGLWALAFGNGDSDKALTTLFYTAGFANQTDGVFGAIDFTSMTVPNPY